MKYPINNKIILKGIKIILFILFILFMTLTSSKNIEDKDTPNIKLKDKDL